MSPGPHGPVIRGGSRVGKSVMEDAAKDERITLYDRFEELGRDLEELKKESWLVQIGTSDDVIFYPVIRLSPSGEYCNAGEIAAAPAGMSPWIRTEFVYLVERMDIEC